MKGSTAKSAVARDNPESGELLFNLRGIRSNIQQADEFDGKDNTRIRIILSIILIQLFPLEQ